MKIKKFVAITFFILLSCKNSIKPESISINTFDRVRAIKYKNTTDLYDKSPAQAFVYSDDISLENELVYHCKKIDISDQRLLNPKLINPKTIAVSRDGDIVYFISSSCGYENESMCLFEDPKTKKIFYQGNLIYKLSVKDKKLSFLNLNNSNVSCTIDTKKLEIDDNNNIYIKDIDSSSEKLLYVPYESFIYKISKDFDVSKLTSIMDLYYSDSNSNNNLIYKFNFNIKENKLNIHNGKVSKLEIDFKNLNRDYIYSNIKETFSMKDLFEIGNLNELVPNIKNKSLLLKIGSNDFTLTFPNNKFDEKDYLNYRNTILNPKYNNKGQLFFSDNRYLFKIDLDNKTIEKILSISNEPYFKDDIVGSIGDISFDKNDNLYLTDYRLNAIKKVDIYGSISTIYHE